MLRFSCFFLLYINIGSIAAQDLFEHFSHKNGHNRIVSFLPAEDGIFYHDNSTQSKIKFISYENEVEVLWASTNYVSNWSEFHELEGNDWILFMSNIIDYDALLSEFWIFQYIDGQLTQEFFEYYDEDFYLASVTDILYLTDISILLVSDDRLIELNINGEIINNVPISQATGALLNENQFGEKYLSTFDGKIYSIGNDLDLLLKNDTGFNITHSSSLGDNKTMIGTENKIIVYNSDYTEVITSIDAPSNGKIKSILSLPNYQSYVLEEVDENYLVWHLSPDSDFTLLHREDCENLQYKTLGFHGNHIFEFGSRDFQFGHFKSFNIDASFNDQVERPTIDLDVFRVCLKDDYIVYDTTPNFIIETRFKDYYYELEWTNTGSMDINCYDLYISYYPSHVVPTLGQHISYPDTIIQPGQTVKYEGWLTINEDFATMFFTNYQPDELSISGANNLPICMDYSIKYVGILGSEDLSLSKDLALKVFPNPANNILSIEKLMPNEIVKIFDIQGNLIWRGISSSGRITVDISSYEKGIYFITNATKSHRFIKN